MIFVLVAPPASGKSSIAKKLGIPQLKTTTTRKIRCGEKGDEYNFISKLKFIFKIIKGDFVEFDEKTGDLYGLERSVVGEAIASNKDCVVVLTMDGARKLQQEYGKDLVETIFIKTNRQKCIDRMVKRGDKREKLKRKLKSADENRDWDNWSYCDHVALNDGDINDAVENIKTIISNKIVLDLDSTVIQSVGRFIDIYNYKYGRNANWKDVRSWNFKETCEFNNLSEVEDIFNDEWFYHKDHINFIENSIENINKLKEIPNTTLMFCTIGGEINNVGKIKLMSEIFPDIQIVTITQNKPVMNKSILGLRKRDWLVDDHSKNLYSVRCENKLLFQHNGIEMNYNKGWDGIRVNNWNDVYEKIYSSIDKS